MIYRNRFLWLALTALSCFLCGCDSRPNKPLPVIPKPPPKVEEEWLSFDRDAVDAAVLGQEQEAQPANRAQPSTTPKSTVAKPVEFVSDFSGGATWLDADGSQLPLEYWEVQYFNAQRIGITQYRVDPEKSGIKIRIVTNMQIQSAGRSLRQAITLETREQLDGRMDRFAEELTSGALRSRTDGLVGSKEIRLETNNGEQTTRKQIEWPEGSWGPMGIHQMLLRKPMLAKEARQAKVFLPQMHQLAEVTLQAGQLESTTSPDGLLPDVLPIDVTMKLAKEGIRIRLWTDSAGRVMKTIWPEGLNLSTFRISNDTAVRLQSEDEIKTYLDATLAWESPDKELASARRARLLITSESPDPHKLFSSQSNQLVKPKPVYETFVSLFQPDWQAAAAGPQQLAPNLKDLSSTALLPSDDPLIERLAKQWSGQSSEPQEIAQHLLESVHKHCRQLDFSPAILPVTTVAQNLEGHCVEQAMFLTTLLRSRQIPSRLASGVQLKERNGQLRFYYHMWTEAWLSDHWVPMDPCRGQLTSCAYLKFIDTSLDDADGYQPVLTVLRALKLLKVSEVTRE